MERRKETEQHERRDISYRGCRREEIIFGDEGRFLPPSSRGGGGVGRRGRGGERRRGGGKLERRKEEREIKRERWKIEKRRNLN